MFKQSGMEELVRVSFLLLVFLVIFGCTHAIPMKGTMETIPQTERVPLSLEFITARISVTISMWALEGETNGNSLWGTRA
jgi:hypothetical protein